MGCTSTPSLSVGKVSDAKRAVASQSDANPSAEHQRHIDILNSIPLVPGVERLDSDEKTIGDEVAEIFSKIQKETFAREGQMERGTHAKGSCFPGKLTIYSESKLKSQFGYSNSQAQRLRKGIFALDGSYVAKVRFANAKGMSNSDQVGDVRGFSFIADFGDKLKSYEGDGRQDFMLNNSPNFVTNNAHEFLEMLKAIRLSEGELHVIDPRYASVVPKAVKFGRLYQTSDIKSYATESYWSNLPYAHGRQADGRPSDLVKYKAVRCDGAPVVRESSEGKESNYLQTEIAATAASSGVCFYLQVQFFDLEKIKRQPAGAFHSSHPSWSTLEWIENGGELWDESVLPFQTLAKVEIESGSKEISCQDWYVNTRLHSNPENQPLGSVARVRTLIEEKSRARRMGELR